MNFDTVRAEGLVKLHGMTRALSGVTFSLRAGTVTAIEGPNGSGKSTLVDVLSLLTRPTKGKVFFGTRDAHSRDPSLRAAVGLLSHASLLYPDLTGIENLQLMARLYDLPTGRERGRELCDLFEIGPWSQRAARTYSRGQLQRLGLVRSLLHSPKLWLLDEPSTGLDSHGVDVLVRAIRTERARGAIVVVVSHDVPLLESVADQRIRLERGTVASVVAREGTGV